MNFQTLVQNPWVTHSISLFVGAAASFVVWWGLNHFWIPKISFGREIAKYRVAGGKALFVCAFNNDGKRDIVDVEVVTRVGVKNFNEAGSWLHFSLKTNSSQIPKLEPNRRALVRIFDERESAEYVDAPPVALREKVEKCATLEDIFAIGKDVEIQLHVYGFDQFSGARRHFESPTYKQGDIRNGKLKGLTVVQP